MSLPVKKHCASRAFVTGDAWHGHAGVSVDVGIPILAGEHSFPYPDVSFTGNSRWDDERTGEDTLGSVVGKRGVN
jgi:hypothetical protein